MHTIVNAAEVDPISKSKNFCFQIITDDKTFRFCASDEEELDRWLGAMKSVLSKRNGVEKVLAHQAKEKGKGKELENLKGKALVEATSALTLKAGHPQAV